MIECVISLFFLQVEAGVGVLTSCLLYFSAERIGRFWPRSTKFWGFLHYNSRGSIVCHPTFVA